VPQKLFREMGNVFAAADAHRLAAAKLERKGRRDKAEEHVDQALAFYRSVGATRHIRECETLRRALQVPA
jgi:hypothetical protein